MAGIYIHIPFCKKKCHYCDFFKSTDLSQRTHLLNAINLEIVSRKAELQDETIETVYFGGGTPSVLSTTEIENILHAIKSYYQLHPNAEITMECNPDDINSEYLQEIRNIGINRLSVGIQSFSETDLQLMNRRHKAKQAIDAVKFAQKAGFDNISIDLIYGLPNQDLESWKNNIQQAVDLNVQHISAYHLTYHEGTVFFKKLQTGTLNELPDELSLQQFKTLKEELEKAGFEHYEISNFAKNGLYSKHNTAYWTQGKYLGIGPSSHSFDIKTRRWNVSNISKYIDGLTKNSPCFEEEELSKFDQYNDYIITRLRTIWGISETEIEDDFRNHFGETVTKYCISGHMIKKTDVFVLTTEGLFISDKIMEDLMVTG